MSQFNVALVGEFNLDLVLYELPVSLPAEHELLASDLALMLGGSPAITANNLARLGKPFRLRRIFHPLNWRCFKLGSITSCLIAAMKPIVDCCKILARCAQESVVGRYMLYEVLVGR